MSEEPISNEPSPHDQVHSGESPAPPPTSSTGDQLPDQPSSESLADAGSALSFASPTSGVTDASFGPAAAALVQEAELAAAERWLEDGYYDDSVAPGELGAFIEGVISDAGFSGQGPKVAFDVPDDSDYAGWYSSETEVVHLHPRLLDRATVLHELAHWGRPHVGHGPQFRALLVSMIRRHIGDDHGDILLDEFSNRGLEVDPGWM